MKRRVAAPVACLAVAMSVTACQRAPDARSPSSVTILYDADERLFGPYWSIEAWFLMFLPLVTWDEQGEIAPKLARRWERSADARVWTFHLRSDVRWHDGAPTTAHDVKFTLELQGHRAVLFDDAWHDVDSISVPDDTTLTIYYRRPKDALNTWMVYWPKHLLEGLPPTDYMSWDFWSRPVGNGPYRYVRHVSQTMVELEANPDFYAGKPAIDRVVVRFGGASPITELLSGTVDITAWANLADLSKLAGDPRFRVYYQLSPEVPWLTVLAWNHRHPALADARVRRAFTSAINRRELLEILNLPPDLGLADAPYTPRQYRRRDLPGLIPYDPGTANDLLAAAGWRDADEDGIRERSGKPLGFSLLAGPGHDRTVAVYVQAALRRVGADVAVEPMERSALNQRLQSGDFDAALSPFWNHPDSHLAWFGPGIGQSRQRPESAILGYRNPEVARLLAAAHAAYDLTARDSLYREVAPLIEAEVPVTFLFPTVQAYVVRRDVRGLMEPYRADPVQFLEYLWREAR